MQTWLRSVCLPSRHNIDIRSSLLVKLLKGSSTNVQWSTILLPHLPSCWWQTLPLSNGELIWTTFRIKISGLAWRTSPHKCPGAQSRLLRMHSVLAHALRTYSPGTDGQPYSNVVHVQAGRIWTSPLYQEAISLWKLYIHHHITPVALHLSGLQNTLADQLSMQYPDNDKCSVEHLLQVGYSRIDLFAMNQNIKCQMFCYWGGPIQAQCWMSSSFLGHQTSSIHTNLFH